MKKMFRISTPEEMENLAKRLHSHCKNGMVIYLSGDLGAGKTTFVRGFLRGMGYIGNVKSPTYTLVEPYEIQKKIVYHFDFYRLNSAVELEYAGVRDYFQENVLCLIEWPEKGSDQLPSSDLHLYISIKDSLRLVRIEARSDRGQHVLQNLDRQ